MWPVPCSDTQSEAPGTISRQASECRVCGNADLKAYLSLGNQPLANALVTTPSPTNEIRVPLVIQLCPVCGLSQLTEVVNPDLLFQGYPFRSGTSPGWHAHCQKVVALVRGNFPDARFVVDIASNDGTQLSYFLQSGYRVLGIEPDASQAPNIPSLTAYWSREVALDVRANHGPADVVIAQNVLGHVDRVQDFMQGVANILSREGIALIECPDIVRMLLYTEYDTIYHEHLSYWSLTPLRELASLVGLTVVHVEPMGIHGGSLRYWLQHSGPTRSSVDIRQRVEQRQRLRDFSPYKQFSARTDIKLKRERDILETVIHRKQRLAAYAASAKGTVRLNALQALGSPMPAWVADDTPEKIGKYMPGVHIPIVKSERLSEADVLMLLSWNWGSELQRRAQAAGFLGEYL